MKGQDSIKHFPALQFLLFPCLFILTTFPLHAHYYCHDHHHKHHTTAATTATPKSPPQQEQQRQQQQQTMGNAVASAVGACIQAAVSILQLGTSFVLGVLGLALALKNPSAPPPFAPARRSLNLWSVLLLL